MKSIAALTSLTFVASVAAASEPIPFDSPRWQIEAAEHRIEPYKGKTSLVLKGGLAVVADSEFTDGVIEYSCAFPKGRAFAGASWRIQDAANREEFYIRTHQSGNPDANQYTPIFNGQSSWQLYHGEGFGAPVDYQFDTWIPVKIVVSGDEAEVYIGNLENPVLFIDDLKREKASGAVGLNAANFGAVRFADFRYRSLEKPKLEGRVERSKQRPEGAIGTWQVSDPFAEQEIDNKLEIPADLESGLGWTALSSEPTGLANLARVNVLTSETNTAFGKVTVISDRDQVKTVAFGYSDRLRLFVNDRLLYSGTNGYRTRDYRYLGTIGYFDSVTVALRKGSNELLFAVSEDFGGWGVQARFDDFDGVTVVD
jgi:hypothetical protein